MLSLSEILNRSLAGQTPTSAELEYLASVMLSDRRRSLAFGITPANVEEVIRGRSHLLLRVYPNLHPVPSLETLWNLWLPLAMQLAQSQQQLGHPLIQGILGGQGTGKTTLAAILTLILKHLGKSTLSLSLDDLYKTYSDRLALREQERRLIWRGPPGTHDIDLGLAVLDRLRHPDGSIPIPRFDKSAWNGAGDRTQPEIVQGADIVLFEGWFVGVRPIDPVAFENPPPPILTADDKTFARDMNARLADYLPLWARLDRLMVLYPVDYRLSIAWRQQAEREMIAAGKSGMSDSEINEFVNYFWKSLHPELFIKPLTTNPNWVDLVIEINPDHSPGDVYRPSDR
ncbi:glycerate kinase [Trichocoleus sp. FACHB-90]|uniref:glycerate kinase n=1 Tax=Cyanophyceae TaxID=3028117 RepID=UPI001688D0C3|nr:glycerate kinase [Trichocoleus sp. FACHB-90]MBD1928012.1 glycerate kinase [Trichocoleus sp. FACHB-90]